MSIYKIVLTCFTIAIFSLAIDAVKPKKISLSNYKEMQKGSLDGTIINNKGELMLGPSIKKTAGPGSEYYLSIAIDKIGNRYIGTGHKGTVYKIDSQDKISKLFDSNELDIYALLADGNGNLLVGSSPDGRIYRIDSSGKSKTFFNPDEKFIWDLVAHPNGYFYCAVGNSGGVYLIDKTGNGRKLFASEDPHIMKLYVAKNGSVYAGSGNKGLLYRITNQKIRVMFDSPLQEIRGICEDAYGNIYFSANRDSNEKVNPKSSKMIFLAKGKTVSKIVPKEKSILYKIDSAGIVSKVWDSKEENIYSVHYDRKKSQVIISTGNSGRVYAIDDDKNYSLIYESESAQAYQMVGTTNGYYLISNNTASIVKIEDRLNSKGSYLSKVFDLKFPSKLGQAYWKAKTSSESRVLLYIRAGNSISPDKTWLKWSAPYSDQKGAKIDISGYQYIQLKAVLNTSNPSRSPIFKYFKLYALPANIAPKINRIKISEKGKLVLIKILAKDPNGDKLRYNLFLKREQNKKWILLKKNTPLKTIPVKKEIFEDGEYLLKVVANDGLENPMNLVKSAVQISDPFKIDSTAPKLQTFQSQSGNVSFAAVDSTSVIDSVYYSYDGLKDWIPVFPVDMVNDSKTERYQFKLKNTKERIIFIKIVDESKNYKIFQKEY